MQTENSELKKKTIKTMKEKKAFMVEITKRLSSSECEKIWRDAHKRLYKMYAEHQDLPKGVAMHTDSFIFPAAAIYLAMKAMDPNMAFGIPTYHRFHINSHIFTKNIKYWRSDGVSTGVVR